MTTMPTAQDCLAIALAAEEGARRPCPDTLASLRALRGAPDADVYGFLNSVSPACYTPGRTIEYSNGQIAVIVAVPSYGTHCACGGFIIQTEEGFALCWQDMETDEEVWSFEDEENPWRETLAEALAEYDAPYASEEDAALKEAWDKA